MTSAVRRLARASRLHSYTQLVRTLPRRPTPLSSFPLLAVTPPNRLLIDALGTMLTVMVGYTCFLAFINVTATRYLRAQAEIALARDIHLYEMVTGAALFAGDTVTDVLAAVLTRDFYLPMDEANAIPKPCVTDPFGQREGQFSPDGRYVAFVSDESGQLEVYVRPFPDASAGKWAISARGGVEPRWSRDGRELFYREGRTIMKVNVALTPTLGDNHRWQVAPDGRRFLLQTYPGNRPIPIRVLVNWYALQAK